MMTSAQWVTGCLCADTDETLPPRHSWGLSRRIYLLHPAFLHVHHPQMILHVLPLLDLHLVTGLDLAIRPLGARDISEILTHYPPSRKPLHHCTIPTT